MDSAPDRRTVLLDQIVDALLVTGVADLSLRPLAERVGTSARLLIYHFDTKETLVDCALERVRARVSESLRARASKEHLTSLTALLELFWEWALEEPHTSYFRLLFEVDGLSMFNRLRVSSEKRQANAMVWLTMIDGAAARLGSVETSARSTLIMATMTGLLQDFISTGERARTTSALAELLTLIPDAEATVALAKEA